MKIERKNTSQGAVSSKEITSTDKSCASVEQSAVATNLGTTASIAPLQSYINILGEENKLAQAEGGVPSAAVCRRGIQTKQQRIIDYVKDKLKRSDLEIVSVRPYGGREEKRIKGSHLLDVRYNLKGKCVEVSEAIYNLLKNDQSICNIGYKLKLAYRYEDGDVTFLEEENLHRKKDKPILHVYLVFLSTEGDQPLILDATTSNFITLKEMFFGTKEELKELLANILTKEPERYKHTFMSIGDPRYVNRYLSGKGGEVEEAVKTVIYNWYGV